MISIVDDDASVRDATGALIRSLGYMARTFTSAEEFLVSGQASESCCLITDVQLSGLNGLELQRRLIDAGSKIPVIFITAFPDEDVRTRALDAGAIGFLIKPFEEEHLIACLQEALRRKGRCRSAKSQMRPAAERLHSGKAPKHT